MKHISVLIVFLFFSSAIFSQCPTIDIDRTNWSIHSFDTEENTGEGPNNGRAIHAIDGNNNTFWHTKWQNFQAEYPHFIAVDMGESHDVTSITLTTRFDNGQTKPKGYELYLSQDGEDWGPVQSGGDLIYDDPNIAGATTHFEFGAVTARYFKIMTFSAYDNGVHSAISEIYAQAADGSEGCAATGQNNQMISFDAVPKQYTDSDDIVLNASASSGLPVTFAIESGPAALDGNIISLTGVGGLVTVTATQEGNSEFYAVSATQSFEVIDLSEIIPEVITAIPDESNIYMPELMAYRLHSRAITEESELLSINTIYFEVDGEPLETVDNNGYYSAWWTPSEFGEHEITITALSENGNESQIQRTVTVSDAIETISAQTLQNAVIDWGTIGSQWYYGTYTLPQSVGAFNKIIADFSVSCPAVPGGCDDWDRLAYIQIKNRDGNWIELFRYITPYGKPCSHSIDVTDYESVLQGEIEFRVFIDTWGTGGWKMNLVLTYEEGTPEYTYTGLQEVWHGTYNFGDYANLQPMPTFYATPPAEAEEATFRLVTTGHGWGPTNTGNAAEFYYATHNLKVDGVNTFLQDMEVICNPNPDGCQPQAGTWQYNRAGWCPGTIPKPYVYDLTPYLGSNFEFDYEFEPGYVDYCHPNHPDCITGITCSDCNDGYNPHYRIGGYMIYKSNSIINVIISGVEEKMELDNTLTIYPNPTKGFFQLKLQNEMKDAVVQIFDVKGTPLKTYYVKNSDELRNKSFDLNHVAPGMYFVRIYNTKNQYTTRLIVQ